MKKTMAMILVALGVLLVALVLWRRYSKMQVADGGKGPKPGCVVEEPIEVKLTDNYARDLGSKGDPVNVAKGYYECNPFQRGDYVYFQISTVLPTIVRRIAAVPGDKFEVMFNKDQDKWNVKVQGEVVMFNDIPFSWGHDKAKPQLRLHEEAHAGVVGEGQLIIMSDIPPGVSDSTTFGLVERSHIKGKATKADGTGKPAEAAEVSKPELATPEDAEPVKVKSKGSNTEM